MIKPVTKDPSGLKGSEPTKNNVDKWGILGILEDSKTDIKHAFSYNPYYRDNSPFILTLEISDKGVFILLKNGTVLRLVGDSSNKIDSIYQTGQIPNIIKFKTIILDISCGIEHSLARGRDCKIYSWGINSYGQLGLDECKVGPRSEVVEPTFIKKFSEWKIKQICAHNYNSFCFDENNVLFGFGKNDQGQIKLTGGDTKISIPEIMADITFEKRKDIKLLFKKNKNTKFYSELSLPGDTMKKNVEQPVHNQQFNEEIKLKEEIKEMQGKVNQLRKNRSTIDDYKNLINEIKSLTIKYEEKPNKGEKPQKQIREEVNPIKNFDKQIEFIQSKKNLTPAEKIKYYENLDGRLMLKKKNGSKEEFKENVQLFSKQIPQIGTLLERVNSELLVQKFHFIEDLHKNEDLGKESEHKVQENLQYIELFKEVIKEIESKIERLSDKDTYEEAENIKEKCLNEFQNFTQNTLKEITTSNLDIQQNIHPTLVDFTFSSSNNLVKLSEKIKNLQIHSRSNKLGKNVLEMFNTNILFAHQNNYLLNYILNRLVSPSYEQTLDKVLIYSNPNNFNEMKHKIETFKNFNEIDEKNNNVLNYSQIEELNSDDENN